MRDVTYVGSAVNPLQRHVAGTIVAMSVTGVVRKL